MENQKKHYLAGITGGSASGKSLLLKKLSGCFSREELCIVSQDDYYKDLKFQVKDHLGVYNFDLPESINHELFFNDISKLMKGEEVTKMEYTFNHPERIPKEKHFYPAKVILAEGLFVFYDKRMLEACDLKIYISAENDICYNRRFKRDKTERGIPEDLILHQWKHHVLPAYEQFILPVQPQCNLIINNNTNFDEAFAMLCNHFRTICNSIR